VTAMTNVLPAERDCGKELVSRPLSALVKAAVGNGVSRAPGGLQAGTGGFPLGDRKFPGPSRQPWAESHFLPQKNLAQGKRQEPSISVG
jgi:hypothetical protein